MSGVAAVSGLHRDQAMQVFSMRGLRWRRALAAVCIVVASVTNAQAQTAAGEIEGYKLPVPGRKVDGTTARLSEVEAEIVNRLPPQGQAERLLQYAISRQVGATDEIKARVEHWRGRIARTATLNTLMDVALNGADLRVRAAACEIELAAFDVVRTVEQVDALFEQVRRNPAGARHPIWLLGLLANRGVDVDRILTELRALKLSPEANVRLWAVSAIGFIGTDATVMDLVDAFRHDPSFDVRINGGGCGVAHCGMLTRAQRMQAVPALIELVADKAVDPNTVMYGYRALREITDEQLGNDPTVWREWYALNGAAVTDRFRRFDK